MDTEAPDNKSVYISYAIEDDSHNEWVRSLALRLKDLGVEVVLDAFDFPNGDAETAKAFAVNAAFILVVCTPLYRYRAINNIGGVGEEYPILKCFFQPYAPKHNKTLFLLKTGTVEKSIPETTVPGVFDFTELESATIEFAKLLSILPKKSLPMKEKIQELIADGRTADALAILSLHQNDAVALIGRYRNAQKQFNLGLIDFGEWSRVQNQVNNALLEMATRADSNGKGGIAGHSDRQLSGPSKSAAKQAFISYNHLDEIQAYALQEHLEKNGIKVLIDMEMPAGMIIDEFINESLSASNFLIPLISAHSLSSGWVSKEITAGFLAQRLNSKKVVPVLLDKSVFDDEFYLKKAVEINEKIDRLKDKITKALEITGDVRAYQDDLSRLRDLQANLPAVIQTLKSVKGIDLTDGKFKAGLDEVVKRIKQG